MAGDPERLFSVLRVAAFGLVGAVFVNIS